MLIDVMGVMDPLFKFNYKRNYWATGIFHKKKSKTANNHGPDIDWHLIVHKMWAYQLRVPLSKLHGERVDKII